MSESTIGVQKDQPDDPYNGCSHFQSRAQKAQYIAMRSVLDTEIAQNPDDTTMLRLILDALVDYPDNYAEAERADILTKANLMAPAILAGTTPRETVSNKWIRSFHKHTHVSSIYLINKAADIRDVITCLT